jgi:outer membrane protein assembly factor BamB/uncharacterized membrane protein YhaH (DUF805 family)
LSVLQSFDPARQNPLLIWPGIAIVLLQWLARYGFPLVVPEATAFRAMGAALGGLAVVVWWACFSRASRPDRWGGAALLVATPVMTWGFLHESIATGGMGMLFVIYATPPLCLAFVAWAVAGRRLPDTPRRLAMVATIVLACGVWTLYRTTGITGNRIAEFEWRWAQTAEERLIDLPGRGSPAASSVPVADRPGPTWPGFRGPDRDGVVRDLQIETDWTTSPPVELWRRPIGPGWSSFAARQDLFYTQEQRGEEEVVACYNASTGEPVWTHRDTARFWESGTGAGPRSTPTLSGDRLFALGATGLLNALDAADGTVKWSRNAATDTATEVPLWGIASSPLVVHDVVIVAAAGRLIGYDIVNGEPRWLGPDRGGSWGGYSSPHLLTIDGIAQVLLLSGAGLTSVEPATGALLWEYPWPGFSMIQPAITADGDLLIGADDLGTRRIAVSQRTAGWTIEELWTSTGLKPYFNDFVIDDNHAFGFDGGILACINLEDGERKWKGGRYGHGQLLLLADQDLLLVLSERGELALVGATPNRFTEFARIPVIKGKTWNHPVLIGDVLLLRNDRQMVGLRLPLARY